MSQGTRPIERVLVLGLDGLDPRLVERLIDAGQLPAMKRLRDLNGLGRLGTTAPAQTPVAWSSFATSRNPGAHGIFDFLVRDPQTYLPDLGLNRFVQKSSFVPPKVVNLRRAPAFWESLSEAGIPSTIIRCPCSYPPEKVRDRVLSGMGVPDLRGGLGTGTFYTTHVDAEPREGERLVRIVPDNNASTYVTEVIGPRNPKDGQDSRLTIRIIVDRDDRSVRIESQGTPRRINVREGTWSDWLRVRFKLGMLTAPRGLVRFHLVRLEPELELYASPVNFDPNAPLFPISHPIEYGMELVDALGPFHTTGMVEDHTGLNNGRLSEEAFLAQCDDAWREREAMLEHELARFRSGLLYCLFDTPDRIQHMFWRHRDPGHPSLRGLKSTPAQASVIDDAYRRADRIVDRVLDAVDDQTLLIVLSDHGFHTFRRCVALNHWLHSKGLLQLKSGIVPGRAAGDMLRYVDWSETRAYAMGLSGLYLNLRGREAEGIVEPEEADPLRREIAECLTGLRDPRDGTVAIRSAKPRDAVYRGAYVEEAPDVLVFCNAGYRIGWGSSRGGIEADPFEDNFEVWSGDHIIDPSLVPGLLLTNRPRREGPARLEDLAPTILEAFDCPVPEAFEGTSLTP